MNDYVLKNREGRVTMSKSNQSTLIIYNSTDGGVSVSLYANDGMVWMTQNQLARTF